MTIFGEFASGRELLGSQCRSRHLDCRSFLLRV
jgi:hypothetical protein